MNSLNMSFFAPHTVTQRVGRRRNSVERKRFMRCGAFSNRVVTGGHVDT